MEFVIKFASPAALNLVLHALAQRPFAEVAPLIRDIEAQAHAQEDAARKPPIPAEAQR